MTPRETIPLFQAVAIMEGLTNANHPLHEQAKALFAEMQEKVRVESVKQGQEMMQEQWNRMTPEEAASFHKAWLD